MHSTPIKFKEVDERFNIYKVQLVLKTSSRGSTPAAETLLRFNPSLLDKFIDAIVSLTSRLLNNADAYKY
jgi:hypothetical protein